MNGTVIQVLSLWFIAPLVFSQQTNVLHIRFLINNSLYYAVQQPPPFSRVTADGTLQDAGHVTAARRPAPPADKLVKYSQRCSPRDCVTTCDVSRDPALTGVDIAVQSKLKCTTNQKRRKGGKN